MKQIKYLIILVMALCWTQPVLAAEGVSFYSSGTLGYVLINNQPVLEISHAYQGVSVADRVRIVANRLRNILETGDFLAEELQVVTARQRVSLNYRGQLLVIADAMSAYRKHRTPEALALEWKQQLIEAAAAFSHPYTVVEQAVGLASWYGREFRGRRTACGERFDETRYTAAHRWLPFGTRVRVTNLINNRSVIVVVNDRGPWVQRRLIDLSWAAARAIGLTGVARIKLEVLKNT